jgi:hypothetical protein
MTYEEFLTALRNTPRDWELWHGRIRRARKDDEPYSECPISALDSRSCCFWGEVSGKLGLGPKDIDNILAAADNWNFRDPQIRKDLLSACGLTEAA